MTTICSSDASPGRAIRCLHHDFGVVLWVAYSKRGSAQAEVEEHVESGRWLLARTRR